MSLVTTDSVLMSSWSAIVDLPWSMWAMMEKFRIREVGTYRQRTSAVVSAVLTVITRFVPIDQLWLLR